VIFPASTLAETQWDRPARRPANSQVSGNPFRRILCATMPISGLCRVEGGPLPNQPFLIVAWRWEEFVRLGIVCETLQVFEKGEQPIVGSEPPNLFPIWQ
jgi:hypothetical protein